MVEDERSVNDRLRQKHIRTLEMLQAVVDENAKLKQKLEKVVAFSDGPADETKTKRPCHSDQLEFKLAGELRLLKLDHEDKCRQLRELQKQAEERRLSTERQAETRVGVARRKQQVAEKRAKELEAELAKSQKNLQGARKQSKELEAELEETHAEKQKAKGDLSKGVELIHLRARVAELEKHEKQWEQGRAAQQAELKAVKEGATKDRELLQKSEELLTQAQKQEHEAREQYVQTQGKAEAERQTREECEQRLVEIAEQLSALQAELASAQQQGAEQQHGEGGREAEKSESERMRLLEENGVLQTELQRLGVQLRGEREEARRRVANLNKQLEAMENAPLNNSSEDAELRKENFMLRKQMDDLRQRQAQAQAQHGQMQMQRQQPRTMGGFRQVAGGVGQSNSRGARAGGGRVRGSHSMSRLPKMMR